MRKLIAVCPRCESFIEVKSTLYPKQYFCPCKAFYTPKVAKKLTVSSMSKIMNENKTECKLVIV